MKFTLGVAVILSTLSLPGFAQVLRGNGLPRFNQSPDFMVIHPFRESPLGTFRRESREFSLLTPLAGLRPAANVVNGEVLGLRNSATLFSRRR